MQRYVMLAAGLAAALWINAAQAEPSKPECIAPAKPGGGFDLTCKLAQSALLDAKTISTPMRVTYMPGGIGAVAYNTVIDKRPKDSNVIVAFSAGSILNLAQGKFGKYDASQVRWLTTIGTDYGMIAVRADSPYKSLPQLMKAIKTAPGKVVFGAGGTIGSQDWMKSAIIAQKAGVKHQDMRYVAFEGGGEAFTALLGGHVHVVSGDLGETVNQLDSRIRVLAVLADQRLSGRFASIPTAKEQGYDISWPTLRGFYVGPKVSDADYQWWLTAFKKAMASPDFPALLESRGLFPLQIAGAELDAEIKKSAADYRRLAESFGLTK